MQVNCISVENGMSDFHWNIVYQAIECVQQWHQSQICELSFLLKHIFPFCFHSVLKLYKKWNFLQEHKLIACLKNALLTI